MRWKSLINRLKEIYDDINQVDNSTVYIQNNLVRIMKKSKNKLDLYFHADINPAFSTEVGLVIASMQSDFNFILDNIEVFYYSENSIYRGNKALEKSEISRISNIKLDLEKEHYLETLDQEQMFHC